jgi:pimeloyl-[acyl-carrier protein] methyl ester esterase
MSAALFCEHGGQGPDVVLVHGWGMHGGVWHDTAAALAARFRVHVVDLPGHGRSRGFVPEPYTLAALADALVHRLPQPAYWIGWSLGGQVTLTAALRHPRAVSRMVLIGATPKFAQGADWRCAMSLPTLAKFAAELERDYAGTLQRFLSLQLGEAGNERETLRRLRTELFRHGQPDPRALRAGLGILKDADLRETLARIAAPTLVLHGGRDMLAPQAAAAALAAGLPQARLDVIEAAAHAPFLSHAAAAHALIEAFLHD